jgi:arginine exporter protein ArgO
MELFLAILGSIGLAWYGWSVMRRVRETEEKLRQMTPEQKQIYDQLQVLFPDD